MEIGAWWAESIASQRVRHGWSDLAHWHATNEATPGEFRRPLKELQQNSGTKKAWEQPDKKEDSSIFLSLSRSPSHHMSSQKYKLKQQWDTTIHPRKWQKFKILTPPNASKDVEKEPSPLLRLQNGTADLEYSLTVSYKIKLFTDYCTFQGTIL